MADPVVVSETIQEFLGERFYLCGAYFQRKGRRLHREVYEHHNGAIPSGSAVHHVDGDRSNNASENLVIMGLCDHAFLHMAERDLPPPSDVALRRAAEWHGSDAGRRWHRRQFEENCKAALARREPMDCAHCGEEFAGLPGRSRFCSNNCKSAARRASGVDLETRHCGACGAAFRVNRYWSTRHCSRSCGCRGAGSS